LIGSMQNSKKRTVNLDGHITSVFLEKEFWDEIVSLSKQNNTTPDRLISDIDQKKTTSNLSSAIRLYVLNHLKNRT
tara:strand:- start:213 stop:440 length:228 start_codon:yes stop_codon:yes gene_type:complete